MKTILEFNCPEEQNEADIARAGLELYCALSGLDQYLRGQIKYCDLPEDVREALQAVRDLIPGELLDRLGG
jgi:hypothetical protein